jgi:hypothetical protein
VNIRRQTLLRLVAPLLLVGAAVAPAAAQDAGNIALKAGINIANISQDDKFSEDDELQSLTGLMAGVAYSRTLHNAFGYQVEALITQKGNTLFNEADDLENTIRLTYLEIPVLATAGYTRPNGMTFRVHAGPTFAFRMAKSEKNHGDSIAEDAELKLKSSDVGLAIGGQVEMNRWQGGVRYTHGLTNIFDDNPDDFSFSEMKNKAVTFFVGYTFR